MIGQMARLMVLMGSGETSPTMTKTHRRVFAALGHPACALLDTPAGFQENVDIVSGKACEYFAESTLQAVEVASVRSSVPELAYETGVARVRSADWVFAGPGSPTYALAQWKASPVPALLDEKLQLGGAVVFSSAAACTAGAFAVPVYEIYKCGFEPFWDEGLDLFGAATGLRAAVIPHFDNAEGGNHDTRFCYLGERRLRILEPLLPEGAIVFGIDEHTAAMFDLEAGTMEVTGNGGVHVRMGGVTVSHASGAVIAIDSLASEPGLRGAAGSVGPVGADGAGGAAGSSSSDGDGRLSGASGSAGVDSDSAAAVEGSARQDGLAVEVDESGARFVAAVAANDAPEATAAALALDASLSAWARDPTSSPERYAATIHGHALLRTMIVRLGELAVGGTRDPREAIAPFVEAMLALRVTARADKRWADADTVRDQLVEAGIELRDGPDGTQWLRAGS